MTSASNVSISQEPSNCKVILASSIAKGLLAEVKTGLKSLGRSPNLLGILANDDPAALVYADWTEKTCIENGFTYTRRIVAKDNVEEAIIAANSDPSVDGMIVYYPIFGPGQDNYLQQIVDTSKDVEGLSHQYIFNMYQNIRFLDSKDDTFRSVKDGNSSRNEDDKINTKSADSGAKTSGGLIEGKQLPKSILPCTPLAVIKILEYLHIYNTILPYGNRLFGRTICVVNRSEVVGRPLAALLANDGATVYSVDVTGVQLFTRGTGLRSRKHEVTEKPGWTIEQCAPLSDVVITGVPGDKYKFPCELLKDGAVCVNFSSEKEEEFTV